MKALRYIIALVFCIIITPSSAAATYLYKGVIKDSIADEPIPYASIYVTGTQAGVVASVNGQFTFNSGMKDVEVRLQAVGYTTKTVKLKVGADNVIFLSSSSKTLDEVVIKKHREKYSKKDNPAVAFIEKVRSKMKESDPLNHQYFVYDKYERMTYGLNDLTDADTQELKKKYNKVKEFVDSSDVTHKKILAISLNEKFSTEYYRKSPKTHKEYVEAQQHVGLDDSFDAESIKKFMDDAFREIDIFQNDVTFMQNRFVSPLSNIATNFYKFYLNDTIEVDGERCVEIDFVPHNSASFGFIGRMYFPVNDSTCFLKKLWMNVPRSINVNYVKRIFLNQEFKKAEDGTRLKVIDDLVMEFQVVGPELFARRSTFYSGHNFSEPKDLTIFSHDAEQILAPGANKYADEYFKENRPVALAQDGNMMRQLLKRLRSSKLFYWTEKFVSVMAKGYLPTGNPSKFDFGPLNTMISGDELEGTRLRIGGMTTAHLHPRLFSRWYAAYGFRDKKLKYQAELEYSFRNKKYHSYEFPIHSLKLYHSYDVDKLGQHYLYTSQDNVFLLLKRKTDDKIKYLRQTKFDYKLELENGFSIGAGFEHNIHEATDFIPFVDGHGNVHTRYRQAGFNVTLRYAPGEKFVQTRSYRFPINIDNPIVTLSHTYLPKGFMGSDFEVNKTELGVQKRFWFSAWGYTDVIVKAAKVWSKVAYPDLLLPNANLSYTIQPESYTLMNAMEFANDQYVSWDVTYWLNGALLNYVPLLKRLKLREVVSFRGLYGSLSDKNDPEKNPDLYQFPASTGCKGLGKKPYMELGVGLDNIFTFLRVDYVWRLTYRDTPGVNKGGVRIQLHFTF
ncbi:MAG: DUF5686 family protein [Bacteroidales bacterium]|nr:DUF5686 family protein [Bacteroidales bacterium]